MKHLKIYEEISNLESSEREALITMDTEGNPELLKFTKNKPPITKGTWKKVRLPEEAGMYVFILTSGKINVSILAPVSDIGNDFPMSGKFEIGETDESSFGGYTCSLYK